MIYNIIDTSRDIVYECDAEFRGTLSFVHCALNIIAFILLGCRQQHKIYSFIMTLEQILFNSYVWLNTDLCPHDPHNDTIFFPFFATLVWLWLGFILYVFGIGLSYCIFNEGPEDVKKEADELWRITTSGSCFE